ncbi:DUF4142 domain-containing protein [Pedobacter lusitanus]|uniref:DUF4142 domain-containing protein n=1 Tax=Pedobacter lusitanus TaxID=1503925 RepID=UPI0006964690|nr:DUF4142 domain-containing protein [Pedobacter lusitanus]
MNYRKIIIFPACIIIWLLACNRAAKTGNPGVTTISADTSLGVLSGAHETNAAKLKPEEAVFVEKVNAGGLMNIEAGRLTLQRTKNPLVKEFAERMVKDHMQINTELTTLAAGLGIKLPDALPAAERSQITGLKQISGINYDQNYMHMMTGNHAKALDLFNGATRFDNSVLTAFAIKTLPAIEKINKWAITTDSLVKAKIQAPKSENIYR